MFETTKKLFCVPCVHTGHWNAPLSAFALDNFHDAHCGQPGGFPGRSCDDVPIWLGVVGDRLYAEHCAHFVDQLKEEKTRQIGLSRAGKARALVTCRFSLFMTGNEWLLDLWRLSFASLTSSVSFSWIIDTSRLSFFAYDFTKSVYFGCNLDEVSGLRICKAIAIRRLRSCTLHSSLHSSVLLLVVFIGPKTSLSITVLPLCICSTLDANFEVAIFRNSEEKSVHVRVCFRLPH